jgi:hypothetical protein
MTNEIGIKIGSSVGKVEEVDVIEKGVEWGEFLRVRIVLDLTKPLARGRMLKLPNRSVWVAFQYEKIPKFCYRCGIIRHGASGCQRDGGRQLSGEAKDNQFGAWLRADSPNRRQGYGRGGRDAGPAARPNRHCSPEEERSRSTAGSRPGEGRFRDATPVKGGVLRGSQINVNPDSAGVKSGNAHLGPKQTICTGFS